MSCERVAVVAVVAAVAVAVAVAVAFCCDLQPPSNTLSLYKEELSRCKVS